MASTTLDLPVDPEPLPPPVLYPAKRVHGVVEAPNENDGIGENFMGQFPAIAMMVPSEQGAVAVPTLKQTGIKSGDIVIIQTPEGELAYWIQRKLCHTTHGCVRLGFRLTKKGDSDAGWTVQRSNGIYPFEMVAIKIQDKQACKHTPKSCRDPNGEFSALQMIAKHDPEGVGHVVTGIVCADDDQTYIIMPHFGDGSLAEFIAESGRLSEGVARHFFRQIITGLCTMKEVGLSHQDLSLESVRLRGTDCFLVGLGLALRVPVQQEESPMPTLLSPQSSCGTQLLFLAPEILQNMPFDAQAVDLWATGVILAIMLYGTCAPFVWASPDDKRYREIAIKGNLRGIARKWESQNDGASPVSDEALDLLQSMLRANPADRLTLEDIQQHPWFLADATPPLPQMWAASSVYRG